MRGTHLAVVLLSIIAAACSSTSGSPASRDAGSDAAADAQGDDAGMCLGPDQVCDPNGSPPQCCAPFACMTGIGPHMQDSGPPKSTCQ